MTLPVASDGVSITKKANSLRGKPRGTDPRKDWNYVPMCEGTDMLPGHPAYRAP